MENNKVYIYGLYSSEKPEEIKYVGKTISSERLTQHINEALYYNHPTYKNNWVKSELKKGNKILLKTIEICEDLNWKEREIYWIAKYKEEGYKLTNFTKGGDGVQMFGEENPNYNKIGDKAQAFMIHRKKHQLKESSRKFSSQSKPVNALNLDGSLYKEYNSIKDACKDLKCGKENISMVICGKRKTYWGFKWEFSNRKVYNLEQIDLNGNIINKFSGFKEAEEHTNINSSNICRSIKKNLKAGGYYWKVI